MPDLKITCDNCGSMFALSYEDDEVSYEPTHCPFCSDFFDNKSEELDFNDDDETDYFGEKELGEDSEYDDR